VESGHLRCLWRRLSNVNQLIAYERVMSDCESQKETFIIEKYYKELKPVFLHLTLAYGKREDMEAAYFAYFLSRHIGRGDEAAKEIQDMMAEYMNKNFYCRINALYALCRFGSEESLVNLILLLDQQGEFLHEKILTEGLLSFSGNHKQLISMLWERLGDMSERMQLAVLNYIRFKSGDYCQGMLQIMEDSGCGKELRLSAIRYFGRYLYAPAQKALLAFAGDKNPVSWEYAAVSVTSLARYEGEEVLKTLVSALHSSNWYVRYNAAASIEAQGLGYKDLAQVIGSHDRYAREMIMYRLERKRMEQKG